MIIHFFLSQPSDVLSGVIKSISLLSFTKLGLKKASPISLENLLLKKLILSHVSLELIGFIQYWSDKLRPKHFMAKIELLSILNSCNTEKRPCLLAGIALPCHHSAKLFCISLLDIFISLQIIPTGKAFMLYISNKS